MRLSEFWELLHTVFGETYARTLARTMALTALDSRTCDEALEAGIPPRDVWHALCDEMDIDPAQRDGGDARRNVPPARHS